MEDSVLTTHSFCTICSQRSRSLKTAGTSDRYPKYENFCGNESLKFRGGNSVVSLTVWRTTRTTKRSQLTANLTGIK